ncbi:putative choline transporter, neither null mutation nor overexpression affects choline transport [Chytridiales sp. JEL 0842]|nr:putative choline transporter, neither null mutation nor overexpression affects choline transport [Chytridiales sp. JEL 0842]
MLNEIRAASDFLAPLHAQAAPTYNTYDPQPGPSTGAPPPPVNAASGGFYKRHEQGEPNPPRIVESRKYQDLWAAVLFLLFTTGVIVLACIGLPQLSEAGKPVARPNNTQPIRATLNTGSGRGSSSPYVDGRDLGGLIGAAVGTGLACSGIWFLLMLKYAGTMIHISYFASFFIMIASAGYFIYLGAIVAAVIWGLFSLLFLLAYYFVRNKIPFAKVMLKTVTRITAQFSGTIVAALVGCVISAVYSIFWLAVLLGMSQFFNKKAQESGDPESQKGAFVAVVLFLLFALYWTLEVARNTVHVTVSGTFATVYFMGVRAAGSDKLEVPVRNATAKSAFRATTTSFGSICYGSLLITVVTFLKGLAAYARDESSDNGNIIGCMIAACLHCILALVEDLLNYFNVYAFAQVAIYGKDYCQAGKDTWALFKSRGWEAVINDNLTGSVLTVGAFTTGLICALVGFIYVQLSQSIPHGEPGVYILVCTVCGIIGLWLFLVLTQVIQAGIVTTFVCLAEDPATLQRQQPELFERIQMTWPEASFGIQSVAYDA